jgi:hypothetical protein
LQPRVRVAVRLLLLIAGGASAVIGLAIWLSWPDNAVADYVSIWQGQRDRVRGLRSRVAAETDPEARAFFAAWLAQEEGDFAAAIRGFESIRSRSRPGTTAYLVSTIRLGQAYGRNNDAARELAAYQSLLPDHPAASRMSQATFHLRRREVETARALLLEALAQDASDGSLGGYRDMAQAMLNSTTPSAQGAERGRR